MTPLARRFAKELMTIKLDKDEADFWSPALGAGASFFELSAVSDMIMEFSANGAHEALVESLFLPSPNTWLEVDLDGTRKCLLLQWRQESNDFRIFELYGMTGFNIYAIGTVGLAGQKKMCQKSAVDWVASEIENGNVTEGDTIICSPNHQTLNDYPKDQWMAIFGFCLAALAVINAPNIMERRIHKPHAGLAKRLRRGAVGNTRIDINGWTEVLLELHPSLESGISKSDPDYAQKCLHWCRAHLRIVRGRLVKVKGHWRGNAELGMSKKVHKVIP